MLEPTFAVAPLVVKPINDLYEFIKDKISQKIDEKKISEIQRTLATRIESVQKVKTIYKGDSAIDLKEFYYPTKVKFNEQSKQISSISDISTEKNIVLQGTAGQGKSVFMRFMTSQEIRRENRIPVFFELRNLLKEESLEQAVISTLSKWLFEIDSHTFKILAESGKLVLFLDGFDEISSEHVKSVIRELEHWSEQYQTLQIIISSRPDSGIEVSNFFEVVPLQPYATDDQLGLIKKLIEDEENFLQVKKALEASSLDIQNLLKTPLMVTLFVMTYRAKLIIPESMSDFYEDIFQVLMYRHDKTKPGFIRELKSSLNEKQLQEIFEYFCFLTKKENLLSFKRNRFIELINISLEKTNHLKLDPSKVLDDITKSLCLIIQDGLEYSFIHKSIQEFFVANFIKNSIELNSEKLYRYIRTQYSEFNIEIVFLKDIDQYKYLKFFYIPEITNLLENYNLRELNFSKLTECIYVTDSEDKNFFLKPNRNIVNDFRLTWAERNLLRIIMKIFSNFASNGIISSSLESMLSEIILEDTELLRNNILKSKDFSIEISNLIDELDEAQNFIFSKEDSSLFDFF